MSEHKIPDDLTGRYIELTLWDKGPPNGMQMPWRCSLGEEAALIERIAKLEAALARMQQPVTRAELDRPWGGAGLVGDANRFNALIAKRDAAPPVAGEGGVMRGTDLTEKQLRAAEQFILSIQADSNNLRPQPGDMIAQRWEDIVRLVAFYGTIRASSMLHGGTVEDPGETFRSGPKRAGKGE